MNIMRSFKPGVTIRQAEPDDLEILAEIHAAAFQTSWSADEIFALLRSNGVTALIASRKNFLGRQKTAGFILVRTAADEAEILTLAVLPSMRRAGIGRALVFEAKRILYPDRIQHIFLEVEESNLAAVNLYKKQGFSWISTRKSYYSKGLDKAAALVMRCDLV